ncbi:MAG: ABC transporter permease [Hungatella hathewayi]|uniref:ABC transporter permease n=1 Tax=Hungatella hathewayi WAL-18680 TaxID=742737 RepID=G5IN65_9FIRM|nr:ABC transporter permease [Hungatella hathewayi]EHI57036.1 hypothetical protein HMPREF9473_04943 [ [Hungatella hathewayi WAL-18680]MBS4983839.1 ABC transporter permease [Hungatella hathewayi]
MNRPLKNVLNNYLMTMICLFSLFIFGLYFRDFFTASNIYKVVIQNTYLFVLSLGLTFIMACGGIDFSIGSQISLLSSIMGVLFSMRLPVAVSFAVLAVCGLLCGLLNGILVSYINIPAYVATMITQIGYKGLSYLISKGAVKTHLPRVVNMLSRKIVLGIQADIWVLLFVVLLTSFILKQTYLGKYIEAVGESWDRAERAGVNVRRVNMICFAASGFFCVIAALMLVSQQSMTAPANGNGIEIFGIIAVACAFPGTIIKSKNHRIIILNLLFSIFFVLCIKNCVRFYGRYPNLEYIILGLVTALVFSVNFILDRKNKNI